MGARRLKSFSEKKSYRAALPKGTRNYAWTLFRPDAAALSELATGVEQRRLSLPIAMRKTLPQAGEAFDHVRIGRPTSAAHAIMVSARCNRENLHNLGADGVRRK